MRKVDVKDKIAELGVDLPLAESFWRIGDLTALRQDGDGCFYRSNYDRGRLLYGLVAKYRPRTVLEFGTGRGYGALCMARSLEENDIDGLVYTVDSLGYTDKTSWVIDRGDGPGLEELSLSEVWPKHFPSSWLDRIHRLNGPSEQVMGRWKRTGLPAPELCFIDGGLDYMTAKHDFYSMLRIAAPSFRILVNNYTRRPGFLGVCELIDQDVSPVFQAESVTLDRRWYQSDHPHDEEPEFAMVYVDSERVKVPWRQALPSSTLDGFVKDYKRQLRLTRGLSAAKALARPLAKRLGLKR